MNVQFYQLLDRTKTPDISMRFGLRAIVDKYPYFQPAIFAYLKCLYVADDVMFTPELQRLAVFISDRKALFYYVMSEVYERFFENKGKREDISVDRTKLLLDAFFETLDDSVLEQKTDYDIPEQSMVSSDYFSYLDTYSDNSEADDLDVRPMKGQSLIDNFIFNAGSEEGVKFEFDVADTNNATNSNPINDLPDDLQDDFFFTETLAGIYIKQHKYERAYEIIKRLNLNFPEKNIYFANQISFLEKLIINKQNKK
ncbi:hypothetical protein [Dysgonomonas sp. 216]|uniref:hypothetical protein n=1 Tax=Dysgonomonas sp. 216 TaxID=2302934 RepID=UPI0013D6205E|nr:hypothetical protein [Dysgonomonas sp. 216]